MVFDFGKHRVHDRQTLCARQSLLSADLEGPGVQLAIATQRIAEPELDQAALTPKIDQECLQVELVPLDESAR
jgi:hypothetical protein